MGVASGSGWNLWVLYIDFLILLIPTPLVYICSFLQQQPYFCCCSFKQKFLNLVPLLFGNKMLLLNNFRNMFGQLMPNHQWDADPLTHMSPYTNTILAI